VGKSVEYLEADWRTSYAGTTKILYPQMNLGRHLSPSGVCPTKIVVLSPSLIAVPYPSIVTVDFSKDFLYMVFQ